jgi:hypothetical protein
MCPINLQLFFALQDNQWNVCKKRREQLQFPNAAQRRVKKTRPVGKTGASSCTRDFYLSRAGVSFSLDTGVSVDFERSASSDQPDAKRVIGTPSSLAL